MSTGALPVSAAAVHPAASATPAAEDQTTVAKKMHQTAKSLFPQLNQIPTHIGRGANIQHPGIPISIAFRGSNSTDDAPFNVIRSGHISLREIPFPDAVSESVRRWTIIPAHQRVEFADWASRILMPEDPKSLVCSIEINVFLPLAGPETHCCLFFTKLHRYSHLHCWEYLDDGSSATYSSSTWDENTTIEISKYGIERRLARLTPSIQMAFVQRAITGSVPALGPDISSIISSFCVEAIITLHIVVGINTTPHQFVHIKAHIWDSTTLNLSWLNNRKTPAEPKAL